MATVCHHLNFIIILFIYLFISIRSMLIYSVIAFRTFAPTHTNNQTTKLMIITESVCIDCVCGKKRAKHTLTHSARLCKSIRKSKYENEWIFPCATLRQSVKQQLRKMLPLDHTHTHTLIRQTFELQVLLVFPRNDIVCDILQDACSRLEMDTFLSQTLPEAIESFQNITNGGHNLIIVDGRLPQLLDPETVARYATIGLNPLCD